MADTNGRWLFVPLLLLIVLVGLFGYQTLRDRRARVSDAARTPIVLATDPVRGGPAAPVTIIEFGDFQCEFCKAEVPKLQLLLAKYQGRVRLVWKDFPLASRHPQAVAAAEYARCADEQGAFWAMHDAIFAQQDKLATLSPDTLAQAAGIGLEQFQICLDSDRTLPLIDASVTDALASGVDGAPYYFINGARFAEPLSEGQFDQIIAQLLAP